MIARHAVRFGAAVCGVCGAEFQKYRHQQATCGASVCVRQLWRRRNPHKVSESNTRQRFKQVVQGCAHDPELMRVRVALFKFNLFQRRLNRRPVQVGQ